MIYVMSDLHGCYDKYIKMLKKINFCETDKLYILGDIIDRGEGGIDIMLDILDRDNVIMTVGNHEVMASSIFCAVANNPASSKSITKTKKFKNWINDERKTTFDAFCNLENITQKKIFQLTTGAIGQSQVYDELTIGNKHFFLSHTLPEYSEDAFGRPGTIDCNLHDLVFGEPDYEIQYLPDVFFVTGHTPTFLIVPEYNGKIWHGNNHIAIDCGASFGKPLGCICLDTMEEFYVE